MFTLRAHLHAFAALDLRSIAIRLGVNRRDFVRKEDWIEAIDRFWFESSARCTVLAALSDDAKTALASLSVFPAIPRRLFLEQFGRLRQSTPSRLLRNAPPLSPTDELFFAALLHSANAHTPRRSAAFTLPPDLRAVVMELLPPPPDHRTFAHLDPPSPQTLIHDVAQTLICLHSFTALEDAPIGRTHTKLTAPRLRILNANLWTPEAPTRALSNSQRLRWLIFWAKAAALLDSANRPTPVAWTWLDLPLAEQLHALWEGWRTALPELRARYVLPDADLPHPWPSLFWTALADLPEAFTVSDLTAALLTDRRWDRYWETHFDSLAELEATVGEMLVQGSTVFGLVTAMPPVCTLTPLARWLFAKDATPPQAASPALPDWRIVDDAYILTVDATLCSSALLQVAPFADLAALPPPISGDSTARGYRFIAHTVGRAVRCGLPLTNLFAALPQLGVDLTPAAMQQIAAWGAPPPAMTVGAYTVLRTSDRTTLSAITQHADLQRIVAEILTPTVALAHGAPDDVRSALYHAGFALEGVNVTADNNAAASGKGSAAAALWLAGQTYALMGKYAPLPLTPPYADLERLLATLPEPQQAALHALRDQLAEDVANVLDGHVYAPTFAPTDPALWLPLLDSAMTQRTLLDMVYVSPARNLPTLHRIEPYWLEAKRSVQYIRAYCHLADAVRLFRLDRIQSLRPTPLDNGD